MHTHLSFKFKVALCSSTKLFKAEIITVTQEASLPLNASPPVWHPFYTHTELGSLLLTSN